MSSSIRTASFTESYESSDHEHINDQNTDQEHQREVIKQEEFRTTNGHGEATATHMSQAYSDQKHLSNGNDRGGSKAKRPTHFVCFPLVTDASVPQLAESLRRFREITTAPPPLRSSEIQRQQREREQATPVRDAAPSRTMQDQTPEAERAVSLEKEANGSAGLKVVPLAAHRPAGTFHLTIGAMDLSDKGELQRALEVLRSIDYGVLLRDTRMKQHENGISAGDRRTNEVAMDTTKPETSNSSSSTVNANARNPHTTTHAMSNVAPIPYASQEPRSRPEQRLENGHGNSPSHAYTNGNMKRSVLYPDGTTLNNTTDIYGRQGYKETVSTVDRYVDKGYNMKERMKQRVKHPLKSLKKNVSPPPSVAGRRLLSVDSSRVGSVGDAGSLRTVTTNNSGGTERPKMQTLQEEPGLTTKTVATTTTHVEPTKTKPFRVTLKGLGAFQSARKARVFYAPPSDPDGTLLAFANAIRQVFKDEGLVNEDRALTLHATVANMTYAQKTNHHHGRGGRGGKGGTGGGRGGAPRTVDGTEVIEHFNGVGGSDGLGDGEEWVWAENVVVDRVRICKMGAEKSDDETLGMVYRAVEVEVENGKKDRAEILFA